MTALDLEERACPTCGETFLVFRWAPQGVPCAYCAQPPSTSARRYARKQTSFAFTKKGSRR